MKKLNEEIQLILDAYNDRDLLKAEKNAKNLILKNPKAVFLYNLMGLILASQNKFDEAIGYYEKGIKIDPSFALIYNNLGLLHRNLNTGESIKKAEYFYKKSISLNQNIAEPYNNLGNLLSSLTKYEDAEDCYRKAILVNSQFSQSYFNLGTLFLATGKINDAKINFNKAIEINPNFASAHRSLSRILKYSNDSKHLKQLIDLHNNKNLNNKHDRIELGFALGKAHEDIKKYKESFKYYKEANYLCKKNINFSLKKERKIFQNIKDTYNKDLFNKFINSGSHDQSPIFIVGMPRSGTTLVEQILSSHTKVFGADEVETIPFLLKKYFNERDMRLYFNNVINFEKSLLKTIGDEYISKMKDFSNNSEKTTDKLPINFMSIGFIKLILPKAKIIHCYRNSKDNIFSIFKNYFPGDRVNFSYDLKDSVEFYNLYFDLMNYWNFHLKDFIFNIKYENLIYETNKEISSLLNFCNLKWEDNCINFYKNKRPIKTASDTQVRNKIYNTSINSWKKYEIYFNDYLTNLKY